MQSIQQCNSAGLSVTTDSWTMNLDIYREQYKYKYKQSFVKRPFTKSQKAPGKARMNKNVFSLLLNITEEIFISLISRGNMFQKVGPETRKLRGPKVIVA